MKIPTSVGHRVPDLDADVLHALTRHISSAPSLASVSIRNCVAMDIGHPQCQHGEDEDPLMCLQKYIDNKVVLPYASQRCPSPMYPSEMDIFATPCNGIQECADGSDESNCSKSIISMIVLVTTALCIALTYLGAKCGLFIYNKLIGVEEQNIKILSKDDDDYIFSRYETFNDENSLNSKGIIKEMNTYLLHIIFTEPKETIKKICLRYCEL